MLIAKKSRLRILMLQATSVCACAAQKNRVAKRRNARQTMWDKYSRDERRNGSLFLSCSVVFIATVRERKMCYREGYASWNNRRVICNLYAHALHFFFSPGLAPRAKCRVRLGWLMQATYTWVSLYYAYVRILCVRDVWLPQCCYR